MVIFDIHTEFKNCFLHAKLYIYPILEIKLSADAPMLL